MPFAKQSAKDWLVRCLREAESVVASITEPKADIAALDAEFSRIAGRSAFKRFFEAFDVTFTAAWTDSVLRRVVDPYVSAASALQSAGRLRLASWSVMVASTVALAIQLAARRPIEPWSSVCPVLGIALGATVFMAAEPIERARKGRMS